MSRRLSLLGLLALLVAGVGYVKLAQTPQQPISTTYILSQAICLTPAPDPPVPLKDGCVPQKVPRGTIVEIQLPGNPSVWTEAFVSPGLRLVDATILNSPGRIVGTSQIYRRRYRVDQMGNLKIRLKETPAFLSKPVGEFTFSIMVQ